MTKRIVLCADDYGQALAISQGVLALVENGRLSAVSCMVNTPCWSEHAAWLKPYQQKVDMGLHFNLTHGQPLSNAYRGAYGNEFLALTQVMQKSFFRQFDRKILAEECAAQVDAFANAIGVLPDFIDGHQHVHQFPVIRDAVVQVYKEKLSAKKAYMRLVNPKIYLSDFLFNIKKIIIVVSGANGLARLLKQHQIPHNQSFAGTYAFDQVQQYPQYFQQFMQESQDQGLIMCHPGLISADSSDPIAKSRDVEFRYLMSEQFTRDCEQSGVAIGKMP